MTAELHITGRSLIWFIIFCLAPRVNFISYLVLKEVQE